MSLPAGEEGKPTYSKEIIEKISKILRKRSKIIVRRPRQSSGRGGP
jgi:hypothetical protein